MENNKRSRARDFKVNSGRFFALQLGMLSILFVFNNCGGNFKVVDPATGEIQSSSSSPQNSENPPASNPQPAPAPSMPNPNPRPMPNPNPAQGPSVTPAPIPSHKVTLSEFGGVPGAAPSSIINAFNQAFTRLKALGGGTLMIAPGVYNIGNFPAEIFIIRVSDLSNVLISGYGAQITMTTTAASGMPVILGFNDPNNVTIAGLSFTDFGTNLNINWKGAVAISVDTSKPSKGFKTVDIVGDQLGTLFRSSYPAVNYTGSHYDIHGTVKNSYYGISSSFNGRFSKANLTAINTRRAFISYGMRDWDITINGSADGNALGSNAFISMAADHRGGCENLNIQLNLTGNLRNYGGLVHFYNQGPLSAPSYFRNIKAHVVFNNVSGSTRAFVFDHEYPAGTINGSSPRPYEQIILSGQVIGSFAGQMIALATQSTATTNSILVSSSIAAYQNMGSLPNYFKVGP